MQLSPSCLNVKKLTYKGRQMNDHKTCRSVEGCSGSFGEGGVAGRALPIRMQLGTRCHLVLANRVQSPAGSPDFSKWESCRTMPLAGGFSRGSPVSPAPSFRRRSIFASITLIQQPKSLNSTLLLISTRSTTETLHANSVHVAQRKLCTPIQCLARRSEGASAARINVVLIDPALPFLKRANNNQFVLHGGVAQGFSPVVIVPDSATGRGGFSRESDVFPVTAFQCRLHTSLHLSPSSAPKTAMLRTAQTFSLTHALIHSLESPYLQMHNGKIIIPHPTESINPLLVIAKYVRLVPDTSVVKAVQEWLAGQCCTVTPVGGRMLYCASGLADDGERGSGVTVMLSQGVVIAADCYLWLSLGESPGLVSPQSIALCEDPRGWWSPGGDGVDNVDSARCKEAKVGRTANAVNARTSRARRGRWSRVLPSPEGCSSSSSRRVLQLKASAGGALMQKSLLRLATSRRGDTATAICLLLGSVLVWNRHRGRKPSRHWLAADAANSSNTRQQNGVPCRQRVGTSSPNEGPGNLVASTGSPDKVDVAAIVNLAKWGELVTDALGRVPNTRPFNPSNVRVGDTSPRVCASARSIVGLAEHRNETPHLSTSPQSLNSFEQVQTAVPLRITHSSALRKSSHGERPTFYNCDVIDKVRNLVRNLPRKIGRVQLPNLVRRLAVLGG
ncbi:hypothetical protein PR048_006483 [Dryococelus australis]|uniref:Uncharacterized protein n=1 Tax=Dryococelus australis TaxID=614101 RepID=A0ABQ9IB39_9NEOP|nr:hypothetical protein PR048_006483 [Dryococelus australis]